MDKITKFFTTPNFFEIFFAVSFALGVSSTGKVDHDHPAMMPLFCMAIMAIISES